MARKIQVEIAGDSRDIERAFKRAGNSADKFGRKLRALSGKGLGGRKGLFKGAGVSGALGGAGLVGGAVFGGVASVKAAAGFEKTMARVQGLAGQSQKQVAAWGNELLSLGPKLGKAPTELAEALYFVASSGVPAAKAISVVTASAKAAAAGLGETEVVADAVTSVMNAYASSGMGAARATDALVAIVREGKGEADAFAGVIGNVAAFASRLKVPIEEVGAALAAMTQLGTDPATAATQLQAFFSQIAKPSNVAENAIANFGNGIQFPDLQKSLTKDGLLATLELIKKSFKGNIFGMAQSFPNIRALRALLALTADDGGKVAGIFDRMADSSGSLGTAFGAAQKTASFNMGKFTASIETLKIAFGQGLLPMVTKVSQALANKLANPAFVAKVRELGVLVGTTLWTAFQKISQWFAAHWGQIKAGILTAGIVIRGVAKAVRDLSAAFVPLAKVASFVIRNSLIAPMMAFLAVLSGMLTVFSKLPFFGGKFKGALESVNATRESLSGVNEALIVGGAGQTKKEKQRQRDIRASSAAVGRTEAQRRMAARGRGPNQATTVHVYIDGKPVANVVTREQQRTDKSTAASRRGRHGGVKR